MMLPAILEKLTFVIALPVLSVLKMVTARKAMLGVPDAVPMVCFLVVLTKTSPRGR